MFLSRCLTRHTTVISWVRDFHAPPSLLRRRKSFTPDEDRVILQLHKEKKSVAEICEILGRNTSSIYARFKRIGYEPCGIAAVKGRAVYTAEEKQLLFRLKKEGNSWKEIGLHFPNRRRNALQDIYCYYGDSAPETTKIKGNGFTQEEDALILELRDKTTPPTPWVEISRKLGNHRSRHAIQNRYSRILVPDRASRTPALNPRHWTGTEVKVLEDQLALGTPEFEIATMLGKNIRAVQKKINFIKRGSYHVDPLKSQSEKPRRWTSEQEENLRTLKLSGRSSDEIATQLGTTINAIYSKWYRLQGEDKGRAKSSESDRLIEATRSRNAT